MFELTGRPMKGWLLAEAGQASEDDLRRRRVDRAVAKLWLFYKTALRQK